MTTLKIHTLKPWLKSVFEADAREPSLKAIDLELANSLCLNENSLYQQQSQTLDLEHREEDLRLYAYLIIKLSQALSRGEVCIDLSALYDMQNKIGISVANINSAISIFVTIKEIDHQRLTEKKPSDLVVNYPLVHMQGRLYFSRYWFYQHQVFFSVNTRLTDTHSQPSDVDTLSATLQQLFPASQNQDDGVNWQMLAAANACLNRFSVITGGPGTGKTTTVTRLLAALISQQPNLRIALAAPTGKAAARLVESILGAKANLAESFPLAEKIPVNSFTLHRLLGWRPDGFSYNHKKTLPYDLVIVDEASMVDLPMMAQLIEALADSSRLILLGDKDQLASVEAGSVLGDLCDSGVMVNSYPAHGLTNIRAAELERLCGLPQEKLNEFIEVDAPLMANSLSQLRKSYRFTSDSGIGRLAEAVNLGRGDLVNQSFINHLDIKRWGHLSAPFSKDVNESLLAAENAWQQQVVQGYGHYLAAMEQNKSPFEVLQFFNNFQLLCALRQGSSGLKALNERVQKLLQSRGLLNIDSHSNAIEQNRWYPGRPVMISRNDYELNLFNGDIGIAMLVDVEAGLGSNKKNTGAKELRVCFVASDSEVSMPRVRQLLPTRLPEHETAFAMTVHKSQGSEFEDVALVLPENYSPVISRELIYTAITRAKKTFSLYADQEVLERGIIARIERASGLRDLLF